MNIIMHECEHCERIIIGDHIEYGDDIYHAECAELMGLMGNTDE